MDFDAGDLEQEEFLGQLDLFTIRTKVRLDAAKHKELTIAGHSSCGCWALLLNAEGQIDFGPRCTTDFLHSGYSMELETETKIAVTYDGFKGTIYINDEIV